MAIHLATRGADRFEDFSVPTDAEMRLRFYRYRRNARRAFSRRGGKDNTRFRESARRERKRLRRSLRGIRKDYPLPAKGA